MIFVSELIIYNLSKVYHKADEPSEYRIIYYNVIHSTAASLSRRGSKSKSSLSELARWLGLFFFFADFEGENFTHNRFMRYTTCFSNLHQRNALEKGKLEAKLFSAAEPRSSSPLHSNCNKSVRR